MRCHRWGEGRAHRSVRMACAPSSAVQMPTSPVPQPTSTTRLRAKYLLLRREKRNTAHPQPQRCVRRCEMTPSSCQQYTRSPVGSRLSSQVAQVAEFSEVAAPRSAICQLAWMRDESTRSLWPERGCQSSRPGRTRKAPTPQKLGSLCCGATENARLLLATRDLASSASPIVPSESVKQRTCAVPNDAEAAPTEKRAHGQRAPERLSQVATKQQRVVPHDGACA